MKRFVQALVPMVLLLALSGCGGGDGGGGGAVQNLPPTTTVNPTTAVIKVSTQGTLPQGASIGGIGITVNLPSTLTVNADSAGKVADAVVVASGVATKATITPPVYAGGKLSFVLASTEQAGFGTGEFVTINCGVASGANPAATDITLGDFKPIDLTGRPISGLSAVHTAEFK